MNFGKQGSRIRDVLQNLSAEHPVKAFVRKRKRTPIIIEVRILQMLAIESQLFYRFQVIANIVQRIKVRQKSLVYSGSEICHIHYRALDESIF